MKQEAIMFVEEQFKSDKKLPPFKAGDTVTVKYRIVEESKERIQDFKGIVIKRQGHAHTAMFTVRKISDGVGVERTFPVNSPFISDVIVNKIGKVRRSKLYYLRTRMGKKLRLKEKINSVKKEVKP